MTLFLIGLAVGILGTLAAQIICWMFACDGDFPGDECQYPTCGCQGKCDVNGGKFEPKVK